MPIRRRASTETIHPIWDAIVYIRQQKQIPNLERVANYIKRKHPTISFDVLEQQLDFAVEDGLVERKKVVGCKGSKVGVEQDSFRIPEKEMETDGHDWYCFTCHKEGDVRLCTTCHRVYHPDCLKEDSSNEKLVCDVCKVLKTKNTLKLENDELNLLLGFCSLRLKEKVLTNREILEIARTEEEKWRYKLLIFENMDLTLLEDNTDNFEYKRWEEFQIDAQTLVHNIVLFFGVHSTSADMARLMLRDCNHELNELQLCPMCYKISNDKRKKFWFCAPCSPPHELVYAKQKGFPYWPAKVLRIENDVYDVRFFGGYHQRANLALEYIKPITTPLQQLQLKRSVALNKALDELKRHQQILGESPKEKKTPIPVKKKRQTSPPSSNSSRSTSQTSRSRKDSTSSDSSSENEAEDESSSQDESPTSSSPKVPRFKDAPTPEDHNVVSSSCQESSPCPKVSVSTQTPKKLLASLIPKPPKVEEKVIPPCDCEQKYSKMFKEFKERIEGEQKEEKDRSLRELAERLRSDFEEEKQRAIVAALEKLQLETAEEKKLSEERLRNSHQMEVTELIERHRLEVSEIKKKQWCYNCEAEAIYHCCWNTSYCSVDCQQVHWHKEHKRTCRRKR